MNRPGKTRLVSSRFLIFIFLYSFMAITWNLKAQSDGEQLLLQLMKDRGDDFQHILNDPERYRVQILYTQIDRDQYNAPSFRSHSYRLNADEYFYPASSIKIFGAALSLEKINRMAIKELNKDTWMRIDSSYSGQQAVTADTSSASGKPSLGHYIKKLLVLSDNDAYNRTYEFLGQEALNMLLRSKGYENIRLTHRLSVPLSGEQNRHTNAMEFYGGKPERIVYRQESKYNPKDFSSQDPILLGRAYTTNDTLIMRPMDFSGKNYSSVMELQKAIRTLIFPKSVPVGERFDLTLEDYRFLYRHMSQLPRETVHPDYRDKPDNYCKFFIYGDNDKAVIPGNIRIFNKIGLAYGFCIDNAYIIDLEKGVEFMLTAVIYANDNQTLNDGVYEYETLAFPFMARLGSMIYEYELERPKQRKPDLEKFRFQYDLPPGAD